VPVRTPIVLVHGGWHGSWCWERLVPGLESSGYQTHVVDWLRSPGGVQRSGFRVRFLDWVDAVSEAIQRAGAPVVLLGHSFGGFLISAAAERWPDRIAALVYLAAYLPVTGENLKELYSSDRQSMLRDAIRVHPLRGSVSIKPEKAVEVFYAACPPDVAGAAKNRLVEQPIRPALHRVQLTGRFAGARKVYVHTLRDRAISYRHQEMMCRRASLLATVTLDTDHSPFFSAPQKLTDIVASRPWENAPRPAGS